MASSEPKQISPGIVVAIIVVLVLAVGWIAYANFGRSSKPVEPAANSKTATD